MYQQRLRFAFLVTCVLISPGISGAEKTIKATVKSVDSNKNSIKFDDLELDVTRKTQIFIDGKKKTLADIKPGQSFKVTYDDALEAAISIVSSDANEATAELVQISELKITPAYTSHSLTNDGLTIYWDGPEGQIWVAKRKTAEERFSEQTSLQINGRHPTLSADELELVFISARSDGKKGESLHSAKRSRKDEPFRRPSEITELLDKSGKSTNKNPFLSADGLTLYFNEFTEGKGVSAQLSTRSSAKEKWSKPKPLPFSQRGDVYLNWPFVSADGCFMLCFEVDKEKKSRLTAWRRDVVTEQFVKQQEVTISDGEPISGRCARYVPATKELFFAGNIGSESGARMSCITNFDSLVPFCPKADSK